MADHGGLKQILTAMVRLGPPSSVVVSEACSQTGADCYGGRTADDGGRPSAIDRR